MAPIVSTTVVAVVAESKGVPNFVTVGNHGKAKGQMQQGRSLRKIWQKLWESMANVSVKNMVVDNVKIRRKEDHNLCVCSERIYPSKNLGKDRGAKSDEKP